MMREIVCLKCSERPMFYNNYDGEWCHRMSGKALRSMLCDRCGKEIGHNDVCFTVSTGINGHHYIRWENGFIKDAVKRTRFSGENK